jgi:hypothetical protein
MRLSLRLCAGGLQERKRARAQPPEGWIGESGSGKKRQVAVRLQHLLSISGKEEQVSWSVVTTMMAPSAG